VGDRFGRDPVGARCRVPVDGGAPRTARAAPDEARWARRAAASAIPFVLLYVAAPWLFPIGGVALGLIALVAIAARRAHAWSTAPAIAVVVPAVAAVGLTLFAVATYTGDRIASSTFVYVGVAMLIPIWLAVGGTLLAGEPATPSR
jgi:hypothetical protein